MNTMSLLMSLLAYYFNTIIKRRIEHFYLEQLLDQVHVAHYLGSISEVLQQEIQSLNGLHDLTFVGLRKLANLTEVSLFRPLVDHLDMVEVRQLSTVFIHVYVVQNVMFFLKSGYFEDDFLSLFNRLHQVLRQVLVPLEVVHFLATALELADES